MTTIRKPPTQLGGVAAVLVLAIAACSEVPTQPRRNLDGLAPQPLVNGVDDFHHTAVGALMIYDPAHPVKPGWRSMCSGALIHPRVFQTAGHCIQGLEARIAAGVVDGAWVSFQQDPNAHFDADPAAVDPVSAGWYEIESLHNNPDNPDFAALMQLSPDSLLAIWRKFHDSGAIVLRNAVEGISPMRLPRVPGTVDKLLAQARCEEGGPACDLLAVGYGLVEFPEVTIPPVLVRRTAPMRYGGIDALFLETIDDPPGSPFGAVCFGDSGGVVTLRKSHGRDQTVVGIISSPADPFVFPCTEASIQYRVDTASHLSFIKGIIQSLHGDRLHAAVRSEE